MKRTVLAAFLLAIITHWSASDVGRASTSSLQDLHLKDMKLSQVISDFESYLEKTMAD
jgi:hypothetical protein